MDRSELMEDFRFDKHMSVWEMFVNLWAAVYNYEPDPKLSMTNQEIIDWVDLCR